jgi:hypothetical protein
MAARRLAHQPPTDSGGSDIVVPWDIQKPDPPLCRPGGPLATSACWVGPGMPQSTMRNPAARTEERTDPMANGTGGSASRAAIEVAEQTELPSLADSLLHPVQPVVRPSSNSRDEAPTSTLHQECREHKSTPDATRAFARGRPQRRSCGHRLAPDATLRTRHLARGAPLACNAVRGSWPACPAAIPCQRPPSFT